MGAARSWAAVAPRVEDYLRALGVRDSAIGERLSTCIRPRYEARMARSPATDPLACAIEESLGLLEDWLRAELTTLPGSSAVLADRASVVAGAVEGWTERWAGLSTENLALRIRAVRLQPLPEPAPLSMDAQPIDLRGCRFRNRLLRFRRSGSQHRGPVSMQSPTPAPSEAGSGLRAGQRLRRTVYFSLVLLTTLATMALLSSAFRDGDITTPLEFALLLLYAVLMLWISASFWTATLGFAVLLRRQRAATQGHVGAAAPPTQVGPPCFKTVLVMPIYNEDPKRVFAGLRAIDQSLVEMGRQEQFEIFVLSDTRDPNLWVKEELQWRHWCQGEGVSGRVFYRNRIENTRRKCGNLDDFCRNWGGRYRYMVVLDADSLMSGPTLVEMVDRMERNPTVALIQVPPVPANHTSLFARMLQFAANLYGPMFTTGLSYWQREASNYWGHNAIIRVQAFVDHCGLPDLPGREPFGGEILSHDFVEAALLHRAGWEVWLADDLGGSYEEIPPTVIDYAKRDRRWCQGNLQHSRLVLSSGFRAISRIHFAMGVMSYLASPLWLLFLVLTGIEAYLQSLEVPVYFFGHNLFPVWPVSHVVQMTTVLWATLAMLFLPKLMALLLLLVDSRRRQAFGGLGRAAASVLFESLFSVLLAPVLMLFQSKFVVAILLRQNVTWGPQRRSDHQTGLSEALSAHGSQMVLGLFAGTLTYLYVPDFFWWFIPVLAGLILVVPVSILMSRTGVGLAARSVDLFLTPQEYALPRVVELLRRYLVAPADRRCRAILAGEPWYWAVVDPCVYALHSALLPVRRAPDRRRSHYLKGLIFKLQDEGSGSLTPSERRDLLSDRQALRELHVLLWAAVTSPLPDAVAGRESGVSAEPQDLEQVASVG